MTDLRADARHIRHMETLFALPPLSDRGIRHEDSVARNAAVRSSLRMRRALLRYGAGNGGLPNLSRQRCEDELLALLLVREDELLLAAKIEAELARPSLLRELAE